MLQFSSVKLTKTRAVALLVAALLWLVSPWDGDFLPVVGWIDDALVLALAIWALQRAWRAPRGQPPPLQRPAESPRLDAWQLLGLKPGASRDEIKRAYRAQMALYHPDKVAHLGCELQRAAEKRTLEIQRAYQELAG